jgi:DNA-binding MarR family transcriptional regulator
MSRFVPSVTGNERSILQAHLRALEPFKDLRRTMPLQYVTAFLLVATEEGLNITDYAVKAGISQSLMVRHLADLGAVNRYHKPGFDLVEQFDDPVDKRFRLMRLTAKGKSLAARIIRAYGR